MVYMGDLVLILQVVEKQGTNKVYKRCQFREPGMVDSLQDCQVVLGLQRLSKWYLLWKGLCAPQIRVCQI